MSKPISVVACCGNVYVKFLEKEVVYHTPNVFSANVWLAKIRYLVSVGLPLPKEIMLKEQPLS